jgi:Insertion element 4 transposase N-terminal/Transposase DDE domain
MASPLFDRVTLGDLTQVFPPDLVDVILTKTGAHQVRTRLLPARLMVYFLLTKALFSPAPYREVLRTLLEATRRQSGWDSWHVPDKAAIFRARQRLGTEPLAELLAQVGPVATQATPGAFWRRWRLMAIDGTTVEVADTPANDKAWGRPTPTRGHGPAGYPQAHVMALIESGTHVIVDAELGSLATGEHQLTPALARSLRAGMLVLGDQGLPSVHLINQVAATGADLLWRVNRRWTLTPQRILPDGSWIATVCTRRHGRETVRVRVIEYVLDDPGRDGRQHYRLITTILDPDAAPAADLGALYHERWEAETTLAEWKTVQIGARHVLTSKTPQLVAQEIYAHLAVHAGLRALMCQVATAGDPPIDPDRLSFSAALRAVRRSVTAGVFPP